MKVLIVASLLLLSLAWIGWRQESAFEHNAALDALTPSSGITVLHFYANW
jgi:hypothetical protein